MKVRTAIDLLLILLSAGLLSGTSAAQGDSGVGAQQILTEAAGALGGLERIRAVKNITLIGYGQYAYMFGGGNITASPNAPQKYQAANDLRRVYDLEHDRYEQFERRNFLFPFAIVGGHDFAPIDQVLDGDIAYDRLPDGEARRVRRWIEDAHHIDGIHMRRMFMLNNPVALIRTALDPQTKLGNVRSIDGVVAIDVTLKQGDKLTLGIDQSSKLPAWVRWANPQSNLGQLTLTTYFTGYEPFSGLQLPMGYRTMLDWRPVDYLKLYVDNYLVDSTIPNLAAPVAVRLSPEPPPATVDVKVTRVGPGLWRLVPYGGTVIEFKDHLAIFELGGDEAIAQADIDTARKLVPGKPLTLYIPSHSHFDHTAGLRVAVAEGLTIVSRRGNEGLFREMATHPAPDFPDSLEKNHRAVKFMPMDDHLQLSDSAMTIDLYHVINNAHMADAVFAYVPSQKVMIEGDIGTAARDYQFWGDSYRDSVDYYKLDVQTISPVHLDIMTNDELTELIKNGVRRARERCAAELAKGNYFAGCPIQSARY